MCMYPVSCQENTNKQSSEEGSDRVHKQVRDSFPVQTAPLVSLYSNISVGKKKGWCPLSSSVVLKNEPEKEFSILDFQSECFMEKAMLYVHDQIQKPGQEK